MNMLSYLTRSLLLPVLARARRKSSPYCFWEHTDIAGFYYEDTRDCGRQGVLVHNIVLRTITTSID
jgi:hypothetical protein